MSEQTRRLTAFLLTGLLTASVFSSCSESRENGDVTTTAGIEGGAQISADNTPVQDETEEATLSDGLPDTDYAGYEFRVAYGTDDINYSVAEDYTGTPVIDAVRDSTLYLENRFNITVTPILYENSRTPYTSSILAGDDAFDIQFAADWAAYPMAKDGLFIDMFTVEQLISQSPGGRRSCSTTSRSAGPCTAPPITSPIWDSTGHGLCLSIRTMRTA